MRPVRVSKAQKDHPWLEVGVKKVRHGGQEIPLIVALPPIETDGDPTLCISQQRRDTRFAAAYVCVIQSRVVLGLWGNLGDNAGLR